MKTPHAVSIAFAARCYTTYLQVRVTAEPQRVECDSPASVFHEPFTPLFTNPDVSTIVGRYWPVRLEEGEPKLFHTEPRVQVLGRCHWRSSSGPVVVMVHGLEGSCDSTYMRWMARAALDAGFDVVRLNVRNCGGTEHLAPTLYHSGLTTDLRAVVEQLASRKIFIIGFSMGGNQALKLAGEWAAKAPRHVLGISAISAPIDLEVCARRLGEPRNRVYERHFLRLLTARYRRKAALFPGRFSLDALPRVRSIVGFDDYITAPAFGFQGAQDYYQRSSALPYLGEVRLPTLLIQAQDDPFIPFESFRVPPNPVIRVLAPRHGGHVAFLARCKPRFWAAEQVIRFCKSFGAVRLRPTD